MTRRSTYTHDHQTGMRVDQYARAVEPLSPDQGNLVRSGYRHYRSTIQGAQSADNLHIVHEWGRPVMPYEHWRFPFRPYGTPYSQWGPPVPNVLSNFNVNGQFGPVGPGGQFGGQFGTGMPVGPGGSVAPLPTPYPGNPNLGGPGFPNTPVYPPGVPGGPGVPGVPGWGGPQPAWPLVPNYQPAPWFDGLYPTAP